MTTPTNGDRSFVHLPAPLPEQWEPSGPKEDTRARLLACLSIGGCAMHLEAFALDPESEEQRFVRLPAEAEFEFSDEEKAFFTLVGGAVETISIEGREYVLIATPYGD